MRRDVRGCSIEDRGKNDEGARDDMRNRGFSAGGFFFPRSLNGAVLLAGARHRSRRFVALKFGLDNSRSRSRSRSRPRRRG